MVRGRGTLRGGTLYCGGLQGPAHLRERDHALQHAVVVDGDHGAEAGEAFGAEQRLKRRLFADAHGQVLLEHVGDRERGAPGADLGVHALSAHDAEEVACWIDDGELTWRVDVASGLENAPKTLAGLFAGANFGKQLLKVGDPAGS